MRLRFLYAYYLKVIALSIALHKKNSAPKGVNPAEFSSNDIEGR
jgi:hypothetical protein